MDNKEREDPHDDIPLVEFNDHDLDGLMDMSFYHGGKIYTFYNMHTPKEAPGATLEAANLCKTQEEIDKDKAKNFF